MKRTALALLLGATAGLVGGCTGSTATPAPKPPASTRSAPTMPTYEPHRAHPPVTPTPSAKPRKTPRKAAASPSAVVLGKPCTVAQIGDTGHAANGEWYVCQRAQGRGAPRWILP